MFDDVIKTQVQGAIRGARKVGEPKYLSDTSVEVVYEVSMNNISMALLPMAERAPVLTAAFRRRATGISTRTWNRR